MLSLFVIERNASGVAVRSGQNIQPSWSLTFHVSGGFAGFDRQLELTSDGTATASDVHRKRQVTRRISGVELQEIDRLAAAAVSSAVPNRTPCPDCLAYSIDLRAAGRQVTIRARDDTLGDSNGELIRALTRLQERLLSEA